MTKLQELKGRLELLPEKHRLKTIVGKLTEFRDQVTAAARSLDAAVAEETTVRRVFGEDASAAAADEVKRAGRVAKRMATKVRAKIEAVSEAKAKVNDDVTAINEAAAKAGKDVKQGWQKLVDQRLKPYERLADVAERYSLSGADHLVKIMAGLRAARAAVPAAPRRADEVAELLQSLPLAVQGLGLEDEAVQKFLVEAAQGTARLKTFHDVQAVAAFVAQNNLWDLFRVSTIPVTGHAR